MKLIVQTIFLLIVPILLTAQIKEPKRFDWKESFTKNKSVRYYYDPEILNQIPNNAMFWVHIKPYSEITKSKQVVKDDIITYERLTYLAKKRNGENYNHGLYDMIKSRGKVLYSTMNNKNNYEVSENSGTYDHSINILPLYEQTIDLAKIENSFIERKLPTYLFDGILYYRDIENKIDVSFDLQNNEIETIYFESGNSTTTVYKEVEKGITRLVQSIDKTNIVTREGYCVLKEDVTEYTQYELEVKSSYEASNNIVQRSIDKNIAKIENRNGEILVDRVANEKGTILISDIMGRIIIQEELHFGQQFYNIEKSGFYFIRIEIDGGIQTHKIFINK